jgi:hypothetical protein
LNGTSRREVEKELIDLGGLSQTWNLTGCLGA